MNRSQQMARIRGRDTAPELMLRRLLWASGYRYRLHHRVLSCRPDLSFPQRRLVVFVDGCFWHGCPSHYVPPRSARDFWAEKLRLNVSRDQRQTALLEQAGWSVLRFWEHEVFESAEWVAQEVGRVLAGGRRSRAVEARVVAVEFLNRSGSLERRHLEDLRSDREIGSVVRERSTRKWRPAGE